MRQLDTHNAEYQASKLRVYLARGGNADRWWRSKDFGREDRVAILAALRDRVPVTVP